MLAPLDEGGHLRCSTMAKTVIHRLAQARPGDFKHAGVCGRICVYGGKEVFTSAACC